MDMNIDVKKKANNDYETDFFQSMNDAVLGKLWKM